MQEVIGTFTNMRSMMWKDLGGLVITSAGFLLVLTS